MTLMERTAHILFYGVMALVVVTCLANIGPFSAMQEANWFAAWGAWFGGAASLATAGAALWISGNQARAHRQEVAREFTRGRELAAYRLFIALTHCQSRVQGTDTSEWRAHTLSNLRAPHGLRRVDPVLVLSAEFALSDLKFVPEVQREVIYLDMLAKRFNREIELFERKDYNIVRQNHEMHADFLIRREVEQDKLIKKIKSDLIPIVSETSIMKDGDQLDAVLS